MMEREKEREKIQGREPPASRGISTSFEGAEDSPSRLGQETLGAIARQLTHQPGVLRCSVWFWRTEMPFHCELIIHNSSHRTSQCPTAISTTENPGRRSSSSRNSRSRRRRRQKRSPVADGYSVGRRIRWQSDESPDIYHSECFCSVRGNIYPLLTDPTHLYLPSIYLLLSITTLQ